MHRLFVVHVAVDRSGDSTMPAAQCVGDRVNSAAGDSRPSPVTSQRCSREGTAEISPISAACSAATHSCGLSTRSFPKYSRIWLAEARTHPLADSHFTVQTPACSTTVRGSRTACRHALCCTLPSRMRITP